MTDSAVADLAVAAVVLLQHRHDVASNATQLRGIGVDALQYLLEAPSLARAGSVAAPDSPHERLGDYRRLYNHLIRREQTLAGIRFRLPGERRR